MGKPITDERLLSQIEEQPLGALHIFVLTLCAVGFGFDLAELALGNILSAIFSAPPYSTHSTQLSWLLAAPYIGGIVGAPTYGWLADRWGRRATLIVMMITLGIFSVLAGQASQIETLIVYRILCGFTLGAFPPVVIAYMTDFLPATRRGRVLIITCAAAILVVPFSIFLIRWLTPIKPFGLDAWRCALITYGVGSIATGLAMFHAPESVRWLIKAGRMEDAKSVLARLGGRAFGTVAYSESQTENEPAVRSYSKSVSLKPWQIATFVIFSFLSAWATVSFPLLSGAILVQKGVKVPDALLYVGIASIGPFLTMFISSFIIDRAGRRPVLWVTGAVMVLTAALFVTANMPWLLIASGLVFQVATSLFVPTTSIYLAEVFSTRLRGRATSSLWAVNRFGSVIAPLIMLPVLRANGAFPIFLITAGALACCLALLIGMPRGRAWLAVN